MNHTCKVLGFVGIEKHDIIMYLSRILFHLKKRILICDISENQAILRGLYQVEKNCLAVERENSSNLGENDLYTLYTVDFRGVDYYLEYDDIDSKELICKLNHEKESYDLILIDFGFSNPQTYEISCDFIWYITDLQKYHLSWLKEHKDKSLVPSFLLIRDVLKCKITPKLIGYELEETHEFQRIFVSYQDFYDNKYKIECQYNQAIRFLKLSKELKQYLLQLVFIVYPDVNQEALKKAYNMARKGK